MNQNIRNGVQYIFWLIVTILIGLQHPDFTHFFIGISLPLISQIIVITILSYYLIPKWLFKNNIFLFILTLLGLVLVLNYLSTELIFSHPQEFREERRPRFEPSAFFVNFLMIVLAAVSCIVIEAFVFIKNKEEALLISKSERIESEIKFLKSQINPHFLFNSLNNIYALAGFDSNKTQLSISYLSNMLRYVIYDCENRKVTLDKEIDYINNFIQLYKIKSSKTFPIHVLFQVEDKHLEIAPMLLIPFVENAFKHSNIEEVHGAYINITLKVCHHKIDFIIDNSIPNYKKNIDEVGGVGIKNAKKRLLLVYPELHQLIINEDEKSFRVQLIINTHV